VQALKADDGKNLHLTGRPGHVQTLIQHDLVDEFQLMIDPLIVGGGKQLFGCRCRFGAPDGRRDAANLRRYKHA
jgi:riboflavin biosynthesis pyrimidine reductase